MIAVVYSGSNHADWRLSDKGKTIASFKTNGVNPYFNDEKHIIQLLNKNINLIHHAEEIKRIYFFGAGSSSKELQSIVCNAFASFFKFAKISVVIMMSCLPHSSRAQDIASDVKRILFIGNSCRSLYTRIASVIFFRAVLWLTNIILRRLAGTEKFRW